MFVFFFLLPRDFKISNFYLRLTVIVIYRKKHVIELIEFAGEYKKNVTWPNFICNII